MTIADTIYEKLKKAPPEVAREVLEFLERLEARQRVAVKVEAESTWDQFHGALKESRIFEGDPVEIQRKLRDEWA